MTLFRVPQSLANSSGLRRIGPLSKGVMARQSMKAPLLSRLDHVGLLATADDAVNFRLYTTLGRGPSPRLTEHQAETLAFRSQLKVIRHRRRESVHALHDKQKAWQTKTGVRSGNRRRRRRRRRGPLSADARRRLREAIMRSKPWLHSTGPTTDAGKAKAAANGRLRRPDPALVQLRGDLAEAQVLVQALRAARLQAGAPLPS
jgi:hypothetical protein